MVIAVGCLILLVGLTGTLWVIVMLWPTTGANNIQEIASNKTENDQNRVLMVEFLKKSLNMVLKSKKISKKSIWDARMLS